MTPIKGNPSLFGFPIVVDESVPPNHFLPKSDKQTAYCYIPTGEIVVEDHHDDQTTE